MARQSHIHLTIPQPCTIPWDGMTPVDNQQRHCSSCDKVVVDFSQMSDDELMLYFRHASGKTCGRFSAEQINRPFHPLPEKVSKAKWWRTLALIPLTLFSKSGKAQTVDSIKNSSVDSIALSTSVEKDSVPPPVAVEKPKSQKKVVLKHKKQPKPVVVEMIMGDINYVPSCTVGNVVYSGPQPYRIPFLPFDFWTWNRVPKQNDSIGETRLHRVADNRKEEPQQPEQPALPSTDPLTGILPEPKKYPWQT